MFVISGLGKIKDFKSTSAGLQQRFPFGKLLPLKFFQLSIFWRNSVVFIRPMILMANDIPYFKRMAPLLLSKLAQLSSIGLAIFTVLATLLYHLPPVEQISMLLLKIRLLQGHLYSCI